MEKSRPVKFSFNQKGNTELIRRTIDRFDWLRAISNIRMQSKIVSHEVTCRNKEIPRNWYIFMPSTVRTLIFHILPPEACSLNISKKVPKVCKMVVYFEIISSRNIFL